MPRKIAKNQRQLKPVLWIFFEGQTEQKYAQLVGSQFKTRVKTLKGQPINKIERSIPGNQVSDKDEIVLLFDTDNKNLKQQVDDFDCKYTTYKLFSDPCIEKWFLLHYSNCKQSKSAKDCLKELQLKCHYQKGCINQQLGKTLLTNYTDATKRAKKNIDATTIYKIWDILKDLK